MEEVLKTLRRLEIKLRAKASVSFSKCEDEDGEAYNRKANIVSECAEIIKIYNQ